MVPYFLVRCGAGAVVGETSSSLIRAISEENLWLALITVQYIKLLERG